MSERKSLGTLENEARAAAVRGDWQRAAKLWQECSGAAIGSQRREWFYRQAQACEAEAEACAAEVRTTALMECASACASLADHLRELARRIRANAPQGNLSRAELAAARGALQQLDKGLAEVQEGLT